MANKLAVIRIRGNIHINERIKRTMLMLNLLRKFHCVVLDNTPVNSGMIRKAKDYVTWGDISPEVEKQLKEKKSEYYFYNGKKEPRPYFRLHPPRGGFERKGTKTSFKNKGVTGYRKEKINELILRML